MTYSRLFVTLVVSLIVLSVPFAPARAQDAELERARQQFEAGQDFYDKGEYEKAAAAFLAAYEVKPFAAFLYNAAVAYEKGKKYESAVEMFRRYLAEDPKAQDRAQVEKRIAALEADLKAAAAVPPPPPPGDVPASQPSDGSTGSAVPPPPPPPAPSKVETLPEARPKGIVVIESKPPGATIYLDSKKKGPIGVTPWNGSLEGEHTVFLESKGYKSEKKKIHPSSDKLLQLYVALSEEHYLGWLEVRANIPGADVYIDRTEVGAVGRTPFMGNIQPGKHRIIVSKEGYTTVERTLEIEAGKAHNLDVQLEVAPIGMIRVRGDGLDRGRVALDGKTVCDKQAICKFPAPEGTHELTVSRRGKKSLSRELRVQRGTEQVVNVRFADKPSRTDAIWQFVFAGVFAGGGFLVQKNKADLASDIGVDEKYVQYAAYGLYGLGGLVFLNGVWYLVRDKGPPSTAIIETRELTVAPYLGPRQAGVSAAFRF